MAFLLKLRRVLTVVLIVLNAFLSAMQAERAAA